MTEEKEVPITEDDVNAAKEIMMATYIRQLRMKLRTMSKKKLVNACVHLAVELYTLQQQNAAAKELEKVPNA